MGATTLPSNPPVECVDYRIMRPLNIGHNPHEGKLFLMDIPILMTLHQKFDSLALLALLTILLLVGLFTILDEVALLLATMPYLGVVIYRVAMVTPQLESDEEDTASSRLQMLANRMTVTVDGLVRASQAINDVTEQQSKRAQEQAEVITMTNQLLDEFHQLSDRISDRAHGVTRVAEQATTISENGREAIQQSIHTMSDIQEQVQVISATIITLGQLTQRVDSIIASVSEIATQSNLLALNASIEAARAGVQGRGFAVVADEVRVLAKQSTASARQVRDILNQIQGAIKETIIATQSGIDDAENGVARTQEARTVILELGQSVNQSHTSVSEIYEVIRQQAHSIEEIVISMDRIQRLTEQNLASTRTVEMVAGNLARLANDLQITVTQDATLQNLNTLLR